LHALTLLRRSEQDELIKHVKENSLPVLTRELVKKFKAMRPSKRNPPFRLSFSATLKKGEQLSASQAREIRGLWQKIKEIGGEKLTTRESSYTASNDPDEEEGS